MRKGVALFLIFLILGNSGCYNIRRKFVRKKRPKQELPVYVDFKDYPQKPSQEAYLDYYLFVRGWLDELIGALARGMSHKREKRAINEAIMNLEQLIGFFNWEGKEKIYPLYEELGQIKREIEIGPNDSEMKRNSLIRKIEQFKRRFEKDFNYSQAEQWMS